MDEVKRALITTLSSRRHGEIVEFVDDNSLSRRAEVIESLGVQRWSTPWDVRRALAYLEGSLVSVSTPDNEEIVSLTQDGRDVVALLGINKEAPEVPDSLPEFPNSVQAVYETSDTDDQIGDLGELLGRSDPETRFFALLALDTLDLPDERVVEEFQQYRDDLITDTDTFVQALSRMFIARNSDEFVLTELPQEKLSINVIEAPEHLRYSFASLFRAFSSDTSEVATLVDTIESHLSVDDNQYVTAFLGGLVEFVDNNGGLLSDETKTVLSRMSRDDDIAGAVPFRRDHLGVYSNSLQVIATLRPGAKDRFDDACEYVLATCEATAPDLGLRPLLGLDRLGRRDAELGAEYVDEVATSLDSEDVQIRCAALRVAGRLADQRNALADFEPRIRDALTEEIAPLRLNAVRALGFAYLKNAIDAASVVDHITPQLTDDYPAVRRIAAVVLKVVGENDPEAVVDEVARLGARLKDDSPEVREQALQTLRNLAEHEPTALDQAVPTLRTRLDDDDAEIRAEVVELLAFLTVTQVVSVSETVPNLRPGIDSESALVRKRTAQAFGDIMDEYPATDQITLDDLYSFLDDSIVKIRQLGAEMLSAVAEEDPESVTPAIPELEELLADDNEDVKKHAALALGHVVQSEPKRIEPIVDQLQDGLDDADATVRKHSAWALGAIALHTSTLGPAVIDDLLACTEDSSASVRQAAILALRVIVRHEPAAISESTERIQSLFADAAHSVRAQAAASIGEIARRESDLVRDTVDGLEELLQDYSPYVRQNAVWALGMLALAEPDAVARRFTGLQPRILDTSDEVRQSATLTVVALARERPEVVVPAIDSLESRLADPVPEVRRNALYALGLIAEENQAAVRDTVQSIQQLLDDDTAAVRQNAAYVLGTVGQSAPDTVTDCVSALKERLEEHNPAVRRNALFALGSIAQQEPDSLADPDDVFRAHLDGDSPVRGAALVSLTVLSSPEESDIESGVQGIPHFIEASPKSFLQFGPEALTDLTDEAPGEVERILDEIVALLGAKEAQTRRAAADALKSVNSVDQTVMDTIRGDLYAIAAEYDGADATDLAAILDHIQSEAAAASPNEFDMSGSIDEPELAVSAYISGSGIEVEPQGASSDPETPADYRDSFEQRSDDISDAAFGDDDISPEDPAAGSHTDIHEASFREKVGEAWVTMIEVWRQERGSQLTRLQELLRDGETPSQCLIRTEVLPLEDSDRPYRPPVYCRSSVNFEDQLLARAFADDLEEQISEWMPDE